MPWAPQPEHDAAGVSSGGAGSGVCEGTVTGVCDALTCPLSFSGFGKFWPHSRHGKPIGGHCGVSKD